MQRVIFVAMVLGALLWQAQPVNAELSGSYEYEVRHDVLGRIGTHKYTFQREGDEFVVLSEIRLLAKLLFVTVRRYEADRREAWRNGRLVAFRSLTKDDDKEIKVSARADGDKLIVEGPDGRVEAPADVFPTSAWSVDFVKHSKVLDTETGAVKDITVTDAGEERIEAAGTAFTAHKYSVTGGIERDLWFDSEGVWVKMRLVRDGDVITVTLKQPPQ